MFDFWPFNLGPSEGWVVLYLLLSGGVTLTTYAVCSALGASLDRRPDGLPDLAAAAPSGPGGVYRTPGRAARHKRLHNGPLPGRGGALD